jgi:hypothetical protein
MPHGERPPCGSLRTFRPRSAMEAQTCLSRAGNTVNSKTLCLRMVVGFSGMVPPGTFFWLMGVGGGIRLNPSMLYSAPA